MLYFITFYILFFFYICFMKTYRYNFLKLKILVYPMILNCLLNTWTVHFWFLQQTSTISINLITPESSLLLYFIYYFHTRVKCHSYFDLVLGGIFNCLTFLGLSLCQSTHFLSQQLRSWNRFTFKIRLTNNRLIILCYNNISKRIFMFIYWF